MLFRSPSKILLSKTRLQLEQLLRLPHLPCFASSEVPLQIAWAHRDYWNCSRLSEEYCSSRNPDGPLPMGQTCIVPSFALGFDHMPRDRLFRNMRREPYCKLALSDDRLRVHSQLTRKTNASQLASTMPRLWSLEFPWMAHHMEIRSSDDTRRCSTQHARSAAQYGHAVGPLAHHTTDGISPQHDRHTLQSVAGSSTTRPPELRACVYRIWNQLRTTKHFQLFANILKATRLPPLLEI